MNTKFTNRASLLVFLGLAISSMAQAQGFAETDVHADTETAKAWYQATYVWQRHDAFPAEYTGPNSLSPDAEHSYSFSATAFLGTRAWSGGELYFNPEVVQSVAFSHLTGLGGLTDAEQQKTAGPNPTFYVARLFLRQTWNLGGGTQEIESSANQLAGAVDKHRLVLTAGGLAVTDLFDTNSYAHDPRSQLLNWAFMTHGAFDFAANARGYTWGAALEYFDGDWAMRAGRFMQPKESNGLALDHRIFAHYGDQVELEHGTEWRGLPGVVRLLAYRNYQRAGGFRDALDYAAVHGGTPDVANVRKDQAKIGFGVAIEQQVARDVGLFARASWNDGALETYAFTEIERSVTAGARVKGRGWNRPDDEIYAGLIANGLSSAHRDYLAAGGLGFFIGDGRIDYRREEIWEVQYVAKVFRGISFALDFQRIANPAYNADRGPVTVIGTRLHCEF